MLISLVNRRQGGEAEIRSRDRPKEIYVSKIRNACPPNLSVSLQHACGKMSMVVYAYNQEAEAGGSPTQ